MARALAAADAALADDPDNPAALRDRAAALGNLKRWREAADTLAHLIDVAPENAADTLAYGTALASQSRWPLALKQYRRLVALTPDEPRAWYNLAVAHQALGRLGDARRAWDRAIELSPDNPEAYARRGEVWCDLRQWRQAADDFGAALRLDPDSADAALNLALAQTKLGLDRAARQTVRGLLDRHPRHVAAMNRLAQLSWSAYLNDPSGNLPLRQHTIDWCRRSLAIDGNQPDIARMLERAVAK